MGFSGDVPRDTTSEVPIGYKNCTFHRIIKVAMAFLPAKNGGDFNGFTSEHAPGMVIIGDSWIGLGPNRRGIGNFKGPVGMMTIWGWENMFYARSGTTEFSICYV
jgi:hypothetical protein